MEHAPAIRRILNRLHGEFRGTFSAETIDRFFEESVGHLEGARVQPFVPLLAERFARERLQAAAQAEVHVVKEVPEVLFVCVHNAGRSQMAAALLDDVAQGRVHVRSAGSAPANEIHDNVRKVMDEVGLDLSKEFPKPLTDEVVRAADIVVTMGCGDACPVYPGKRYLDWDLPDPAGQPLEEVRKVRDEIQRRVVALVEELLAAPT
jgi:arsenate reductase